MHVSTPVVKRIKELLATNNMRIGTLIIRSGISRYTLRQIMKGQTKDVSLKTIMILCVGFEISLSEFFNSEMFDFNFYDFNI